MRPVDVVLQVHAFHFLDIHTSNQSSWLQCLNIRSHIKIVQILRVGPAMSSRCSHPPNAIPLGFSFWSYLLQLHDHHLIISHWLDGSIVSILLSVGGGGSKETWVDMVKDDKSLPAVRWSALQHCMNYPSFKLYKIRFARFSKINLVKWKKMKEKWKNSKYGPDDTGVFTSHCIPF